MANDGTTPAERGGLPGLTLAAVGVVYGDIGTSPLYTLHAAFQPAGGLSPGTDAVLGVLSLVVWSLIVVVSLKYVTLVMRADNKGEGGVLALSALAQRSERRPRYAMVALSIAGAALFYGDGVITPAISVLSAAEGLHVVTPLFDRLVIPLSLAILAALFVVQHFGTGRVGRWFGPIMVVWFLVAGGLGLASIIRTPDVLRALSPLPAVAFFQTHHWQAFLALGAVVLAVTGCEALYADMGHFGRTPIRIAWFGLVLPALALNYFGQGALLLRQPAAINPFFMLAPRWALLPMVALATLATVIASQAVISGAFSISRQATQLGFLPRMRVLHTSATETGQVYIPRVNWLLMAAVVGLVTGFRTSSHMAAAYGVAATGTMAVTVVLAHHVARRTWGWTMPAAAAVFAPLMLADAAFFGANILKIGSGGWFPILLAAGIYFMISTWRRGRSALMNRLYARTMPLDRFVAWVRGDSIRRVPGTAAFLSGRPDVAPRSLMQNIEHNHVLHRRNLIVTVETEDRPHVSEHYRHDVRDWGEGVSSVLLRYGFMDRTDVLGALVECGLLTRDAAMMETSFFLSRVTPVPSDEPDLPPWREGLFVFLSHEAVSATEFLGLPPGRVIELGAQVKI
ncbi:MAG: potassium transporter Kup [Magnetospirillum sp.]|nr:potassium transporter Kup [Magnetospirillum sp.]